MSIETIFRSLEKLVELHQNMYELSLDKTTALKEDAIEELQHILIEERKLTQVVERAEQTRRKRVDEWLNKSGVEAEGTVSNMLDNIADESDRQTLAQLSTALTEEITKLKRNEQMNHDLLHQSLKFVQLSLDVMEPSIKNMNYGTKRHGSYMSSRPVFDSKA